MKFINQPLKDGLVSQETVQRMINLHEEYLIKAWIEIGHFQQVIEEANQELAKFPAEIVAEAKEYLTKRMEMQRAGKSMKDPKSSEVAEAVKWVFNIDALENEQSQYTKAKLNIEFYENVLEALKTLLK